MNAEQVRLEQDREQKLPWKKWGPAERVFEVGKAAAVREVAPPAGSAAGARDAR